MYAYMYICTYVSKMFYLMPPHVAHDERHWGGVGGALEGGKKIHKKKTHNKKNTSCLPTVLTGERH